ncbi:hypothetical protein ACFLT4_05740 [Chloroflexota bacterium]
MDDLLSYLEDNLDVKDSSRNLRDKIGVKEVIVSDKGETEKNTGLVLCLRFKGRERSWGLVKGSSVLQV